jgi:hypothetical protein
MSLRKLLFFVNVFGIVGAILSALIIPRNMTVKVWAASSVAVVVLLNLYVLKAYKPKLAVGPTLSNDWKKYLLISAVVGVILLVLIRWI